MPKMLGPFVWYCEHCHVDFSSESEYNDHLLLVKQEEALGKALAAQEKQAVLMSQINIMLHMWMANNIAREENITFEAATRKLLGEYADAFNRVLDERKAQK